MSNEFKPLAADSDLPEGLREPFYKLWTEYRDWWERQGERADLADFRAGYIHGHAVAIDAINATLEEADAEQ